MDITLLLIGLLLVAVLAVAGWFVRSQQQKSDKHTRPAARPAKPSPRRPAAQPRNPYRATSIRTGESACPAVQSLVTDRFLVESGEIPRLPLPDCDRPERCSCTYVKHGDRRDDYNERRAIGGGGLRDDERRSGGDRRGDE